MFFQFYISFVTAPADVCFYPEYFGWAVVVGGPGVAGQHLACVALKRLLEHIPLLLDFQVCLRPKYVVNVRNKFVKKGKPAAPLGHSGLNYGLFGVLV
jgi:hypothetical protein